MSEQRHDSAVTGLGLSLVWGDLAFRLQRRVGLIPEAGLGLVRRAIFWALLAWLPIVLSAWYLAQTSGPLAAEPLLAHFGIHARFLLAVPLLILAEGSAHELTVRLLPHFVDSGVIPAAEIPRFRAALQDVVKLRDATLPWVTILGLVFALSTIAEIVHHSHEVSWAVADAPTGGRLGFGAWWFLYFARPVYLALLAAWVWRVALVGLLFRRIAKLDLSIVPTHPDTMGGLGFLTRVPTIFAPVVLAVGIVLASRWAHEILYHGVDVQSLRLEMGAFVVISVLLFSSPLFAFMPLMKRTKREALLDYGALVGRHGRLVRDRWIAGKLVPDDALLSAPELGPIADTGPIYDAVAAMRTLPVGKAAVAPLLLAAAVPIAAVLAIEIPIAKILSALVKAII